MRKNIKPILGLITATTVAFLVARDLAKEAPGKVDAARSTAMADIEKTFGFVPHFLNDIPAGALPGTWR